MKAIVISPERLLIAIAEKCQHTIYFGVPVTHKKNDITKEQVTPVNGKSLPAPKC